MRILIVIVSLVICEASHAQISSNYWSHQFGARGQLLNGAVVSSVRDETAIYYNPGAFALYGQSGVSLSLITPSYSVLRTTDYLGDGTSFVDRKGGFAPGLIAAAIKPFKTDRLILGATSFTRFQSSVNYSDRIVNRLTEDEVFVGQLDFNRRLSENWLGGAISWEPTDKLAIGLSNFFTFRGESIRLRFKKEIVAAANPSSIVEGWRNESNFRYRVDGGIISKLGIIWNPGNFILGFTYTTGQRRAFVQRGKYEIDDQKVFGNGETTVASNVINQALESYRPPTSLAGGITFEQGVSEISISMEYFSAVEPYTLFSATDDALDGQGNVEDITTVDITQGSKEVLNLAIGIKKRYAEDKDLFVGFRTDLSPENQIDLGNGISFLSSSPDIFHVSFGVARRYLKSQFSIGVDYGGGVRRGGEQLTNLTTGQAENLFQFAGDPVVDSYVHELTLFITYDL